VAYGSGIGQFELADDVDPDDIGRGDEGNTLNTPYRHEIH